MNPAPPDDRPFTIIPTKQYRKDLKCLEKSGRYKRAKLEGLIELLATGKPLPAKYRNHPLQGFLEGREECHVEADWLLIYRRDRHRLVLLLLRTGTHAKVFGE